MDRSCGILPDALRFSVIKRFNKNRYLCITLKHNEVADIIPGKIRWNLRRGDALNSGVLVEGYNLTGKNVAMDVRSDPESEAVLRFSSEDGSIEIQPHIDQWILIFKKTSQEMKVEVGTYLLDIEAYSNNYDTETFGEGQMVIRHEITRRIK